MACNNMPQATANDCPFCKAVKKTMHAGAENNNEFFAHCRMSSFVRLSFFGSSLGLFSITITSSRSPYTHKKQAERTGDHHFNEIDTHIDTVHFLVNIRIMTCK